MDWNLPKPLRFYVPELLLLIRFVHGGAGPGDLVAVQGIGGLGHLGIQFANKFGYRVAAVGRGPENAALAKKTWRASLPSDSEDILRFAALTGVRPMIEKFPEKAGEAYSRMLGGHAQFRVVLTM
jgi:D-arabinose 1-dehydrogenase-like Zn-dependent alcohol dehydrogenase